MPGRLVIFRFRLLFRIVIGHRHASRVSGSRWSDLRCEMALAMTRQVWGDGWRRLMGGYANPFSRPHVSRGTSPRFLGRIAGFAPPIAVCSYVHLR